MAELEPRLDDATVELWNTWERAADQMGIPKEWRVCAHCGQQSWRFPPHMFSACPFVVEMAEAAGMKMDAERMQAVRAGVQTEVVTAVIREHLEGRGDEYG